MKVFAVAADPVRYYDIFFIKTVRTFDGNTIDIFELFRPYNGNTDLFLKLFRQNSHYSSLVELVDRNERFTKGYDFKDDFGLILDDIKHMRLNAALVDEIQHSGYKYGPDTFD